MTRTRKGAKRMKESFDVKLVENEKYYTSDSNYKRNSWMGDYQKAYNEFLVDPGAFWSKMVHELDWIRLWDAVRKWNFPYAKWFTNAKLNISANCLDHHVKNQRRNKVTLIWKGWANGSNKVENLFEFKKYTEW
jgi:acetyl-CoA synthetase